MTDMPTKPRCVETLREIEAYLDDEVDGTIHVRIQEHLTDCPPCMDRAEFRRSLKVMISTKCSGEHVPPELVTKIHALLHGEAPTG
jgi:mycothiol system anti-sigma-R factor